MWQNSHLRLFYLPRWIDFIDLRIFWYILNSITATTKNQYIPIKKKTVVNGLRRKNVVRVSVNPFVGGSPQHVCLMIAGNESGCQPAKAWLQRGGHPWDVKDPKTCGAGYATNEPGQRWVWVPHATPPPCEQRLCSRVAKSLMQQNTSLLGVVVKSAASLTGCKCVLNLTQDKK